MAKYNKSFRNNPLLVALLCVIIFFLGMYTGQNLQPFVLTSTQSENQLHKQSLQLTNFVDTAVKNIETKKELAFNDFRVKDSQWWQGDKYLFVYDMDGNTLVLPTNTSLEGVNRLAAQDDSGVFYIHEMITRLKDNDSAWVIYTYPKPEKTAGNLKLAYVRKIKLNDKFIFVGSGIYF